jgi:hypothetical protein
MSRIDMKSLKEKSFQNSKEIKKLKKYDFYCILLWKKDKDIYEEKILYLYKENTYKKYKNIYYECFDNNDGFYDEEYVINNPNNYDDSLCIYDNKNDLESDFLYKYKYTTKKNALLHSLDYNVSLYKKTFLNYDTQDEAYESIFEYHENGLLNNLYGYSKIIDTCHHYNNSVGPYCKNYYIKGIEYNKKEYENIIKEKKELLINQLNSSNIYCKVISNIISNYIY